ncbi:MAG: translocation/assembly module TamB domain-containing protein [Thermodesulfobacteriota bacterium]
MKKWILIISAGLLGLVLLLFSAVFFLLGTESGSHFLVTQVEKQLGDDLQIESSSGTFLDRLELSNLTYNGAGGKAKLGHLVLDWKSTDLLRRHLHIQELSAADIAYTSPPPSPKPEAEESSPLTLPELKLPVTITIEQLAIDNFVFLSAPDADPLTVHQANLALLWDKKGINLQELKVRMDEAALDAQGQLNPVGDYPLQFTTALKILDPELPSLSILGEYTGDLKKLEVKESISGDITADLHATATEVIKAPAWQADLDIAELVPAAFSPEAPGMVSGNIETHGNLQQAAATANLSIRDEKTVEYNWDAELDIQANLETMLISINELKLNHVDGPPFIELTGTADTDGPLDLELKWQDLQYPLTGEADYQSTSGKTNLTGKVDQYHLILKADLGGQMIPTTHLELSTDGNLESVDNLNLKATLLEGDFSVQGSAQWSPDISWELTSRAEEITPAVHYEEIPGKVNGSILTSGSLEDANLAATLSVRDEQRVEYNWDSDLDLQADINELLFTINHLKLEQADGPARLQLAGTADTDGPLDIKLHWQDLQYPLTGEADYSSARGDVTLKGTTDQYHLSANSAVAGEMLPTTNLELDTDGNLESIENLKLRADLLDGSVELHGKAQWAPDVSWELGSEGAEINPGAKYEEWPGKLDWQLRTAGSLKEEGVVADVELDHLGGNLRHLGVGGKGEVHVRPETIQVKDLQLSSGSALITAQGELGKESSLSWKIDIPDFSDLLPESGGRVSGEGTVTGEMASPQLALTLSASSVHLPQLDLGKLQGDADIDLSWEKPFHVDLSASNLQAGGNLVEKIGLQGDGSIEEHSAQLQASHELADIKLGLSGGYLEEKWQGLLDSFSLNAEKLELGSWQLNKPAPLVAGATEASLESMCLQRKKAAICLNGSWDNDNQDTGGHVEIREFPLNWLATWFPETLKSVGGVFSLTVDAKMAEQLQADAVAKITPGAISYVTQRKRGQFPHEGMDLTLHAGGEALDADLSLSVDSNSINLELQSPDLLKKDVGTAARLDGRLQVDAKKFDLVASLIPDVEELDAAVNVDFRINGSLEEPSLAGKGVIAVPHVLIPAAGVDLNDTRLDIAANNRELQVNGLFKSPQGSLTLDGEATLDKNRGWPARVSLKGDNFRLINLPKIQVFLTPDILLERGKGFTNLTGTLTIPTADILLRQLPPGSESISPDVVIIQEKKEEEPSSPLTMNLAVSLGDNVHFAGFGLNAFIDGELTMTAEPEEQLLGSGTFHIKEGSFRAYGQDLEIQTGVISFPGGPLTQPGINLQATRTIGEIVAGVSAIGPAAKPRITTFSHPPMSESQTISYLLTGSAPSDSSTGAKLSVGRQINNKLSISVGTDVKTGENEFIARYRLNRKVHVQSTTATNSNAADVFYTVEFGGVENDEE